MLSHKLLFISVMTTALCIKSKNTREIHMVYLEYLYTGADIHLSQFSKLGFTMIQNETMQQFFFLTAFKNSK